jgi:hypothetical protein
MTTATYPKTYPTEDPRVRVAYYGPRDFRLQVRTSPDADWADTGPSHLTRGDAMETTAATVERHFGTPTWDDVRRLQAQAERLATEKAALAADLARERSRSAALLADGDRREQRALALLPDCSAHRRELQYLRHCVSWYWHSTNDSEEARRAIVGALGNTVLRLRDASADFTVKADDLVKWLEEAIDKQNKPLRRTSFPTLADCLRSAVGDCEHDGICEHVKREICEALKLDTAPF